MSSAIQLSTPLVFVATFAVLVLVLVAALFWRATSMLAARSDRESAAMRQILEQQQQFLLETMARAESSAGERLRERLLASEGERARLIESLLRRESELKVFGRYRNAFEGQAVEKSLPRGESPDEPTLAALPEGPGPLGASVERHAGANSDVAKLEQRQRRHQRQIEARPDDPDGEEAAAMARAFVERMDDRPAQSREFSTGPPGDRRPLTVDEEDAFGLRATPGPRDRA